MCREGANAGAGTDGEAGVVVGSGDIAGVSMVARDAAGVVCKVPAAASGDAGVGAFRNGGRLACVP